MVYRIPRTQPSSTQLPSTTTIHDAPHQTRAQTSHGRAHIVSPAAMPPQATAPVPQPRNPVSAQPPSGTSTLPVSTYDRFPEARSRILGRLPVVSIPECATGDILFSTTRLNYILGGGYRMDAEYVDSMVSVVLYSEEQIYSAFTDPYSARRHRTPLSSPSSESLATSSTWRAWIPIFRAEG